MSFITSFMLCLLVCFVFTKPVMANDGSVTVTGTIVKESCDVALNRSDSTFNCSNQKYHQKMSTNQAENGRNANTFYQVNFENLGDTKKLVNINYY